MRRTLIRANCDNCACPQYLLGCRQLPTEVHDFGESGAVDVLFVGHGGGNKEHSVGLPFVGDAGLLLRKAINHLQNTEHFTYAFSNTVRACSEKNRSPEETELDNCLSILAHDIEELKPKVIVPLGKFAADAFQHTEDSFLQVRGAVFNHDVWGTIVPTFHPNSLIINNEKVSLFYDDIRKAVWLSQKKLVIPKKYSEIGQSVLLDTVVEVKEFTEFLKFDLTQDDVVACDTETKNLYKKFGNRVATLQFAHSSDLAYVIPYQHIDNPFTAEELFQVQKYLQSLFTDKVSFKYWLMHNAVFDTGRIYNEIGAWVRNVPIIDTQVMSFLLDENRFKVLLKNDAYKLKCIVKELFGFKEYDKDILKDRETGQLADLPLKGSGADTLVGYGGMDAYMTYRLFRYQEKIADLQGYYSKCMQLLVDVYSKAYIPVTLMEINGFKIDVDFLRILQGEKSPILGPMREIEEQLKTLKTVQKANDIILERENPQGCSTFFTPWVFDINKRLHMEILFGEAMGLKAPPGKNAKTNKPSYSKAWYKPLIPDYIELELYARYNGLKTLKTTYLNSLVSYIEPSFGYLDGRDGKVRGSFWFTSAVTGRTASSNPNMQNIPKSDTAEKKIIKNLFIANTIKGKRNVLIQLDAKTAEVRWWCLLSKDPALAKAFNKAKEFLDLFRKDPNPEYEKQAKFYGDVHRMTASQMFQVSIEDVTPDMRQATKAIVFGLMYGRGTKSLSLQLKKSKKETERLIQKFFDKFPVGTRWFTQVESFCRNNLYFDTPFGRRRRLPFYIDSTQDFRTKNKAVNSPVQSISSDSTLLLGLYLFTDYIIDNKKPWSVVDIVHDSNVFEVPFDFDHILESITVSEQMYTTNLMNYITKHFNFDFCCPLEVDYEIGFEWGNLIKWDGSRKNIDEIYMKLKEVA